MLEKSKTQDVANVRLKAVELMGDHETITLWKAVCENATLAMFIMDERQQCIYMNPAAEALTGYSLEETRGRPLHDVVHHTRPDGSPFPLEECPIDRAFPENAQEQGEEVFVHKDGSFYPVAFTASPLRGEGSDIIGTIVEVRGIAQERADQERLEETERRLQFALSAGRAVGTWDWDVKADILYADARFAHVFGHEAEATKQGLPLAAFVASIVPEDRERVTALISQAMETGEEYEAEYDVVTADGERATVLARGRCAHDDAGNPTHFPGVVIDITKQKRNEIELARREAEFRTITEAVPQMVWATRPDGYHDFYNARWYEFTGTAPGSTDGEGWNDLFHPDDQEAAWARWRHSLATGEPYEIEYRLRHHSGVYRWVLGRALPVRDEERKIIRWFGTCTDIHDLKEAQEHAELLARELDHRVKNTLQTVQAIAMNSLRTAGDKETAYKDFVERIQALSSVHNLLTLENWNGVDLRAVVGAALMPFGCDTQDARSRFHLEGPPVPLAPKQAQTFAMALHELATNAAKYGALSNQTGSIDVAWSFDTKNGTLDLKWREKDGPAVAEPTRKGFGTLMLTRLLAAEVEGTITIDYAPGGVTCSLSGRV